MGAKDGKHTVAMDGLGGAICLATNNAHKLRELKEILGESAQVLSLSDIGCTEEIPEDQPTIEGNSLQKALFVWEKYKVSCVADDTGLLVEALNGEPGVYSARYGGPQRSNDDNIALLLRKLEGTANRNAHFKTVVTFIDSGRIYQFEGKVFWQNSGRKARKRRLRIRPGVSPRR